MHSAMHTWLNYKSNWPGTMALISSFTEYFNTVEGVYTVAEALGFGRCSKLLVT